MFIVVIIFLCLHSLQANGQSIVYPGIQTSTEAGLSQTNTIGTSSILWNPANLPLIPLAKRESQKKKRKVLRGVEVYSDFSLLNFEYSYSRSGYAPVRLAATAPPVTLGASWRPQTKFAFGAIFIPRPSSKPQTLKGVPLQQGKEVIVVDADALSSSVISGFGLGVKPNDRFSLGLSLIETAENGSLSATPQDAKAGDVPLFQMSFSGSFIQFLAGTRIQMNDSTLMAASVKTSVVKNYTGDLSIAGGTPEPTSRQGYAPMEFALGIEKKLDAKVFFGEYRRLGWAAGSSNVKAGTPGGAMSKAYQDVNVFIFGGRYWFTDNNVGSASFGYYPANVGFGSSLNANGLSDDGDLVGGVDLGDMDSLTKQVIAGSFKMNLSDSYIQTGISIQNASRDVPTRYANEGSYRLSAYTLAFGGGKSF